VLFAIMILGIGFIMVAAIFPVAIQQTQNNSSEGTAASIARGAVANLQQTLLDSDIPRITPPPGPGGFPGRARVYSFRDPQTSRPNDKRFGDWLGRQTKPSPDWKYPEQLSDRTQGSQIVANDPRFGWVGFFRREPASAYVQLYVIVTQARVRPTYQPQYDLVPPKRGGGMINLQARPVVVGLTSDGDKGGGGNDKVDQVIRFEPGSPGFAAVAEGCYVIIANDNLAPGAGVSPTPPNLATPAGARVGWMNGRIYRVGNRTAGSTTDWELMAGNDFAPDPGPDATFGTGDDVKGLTGADAFVVGRTFVGPGEPAPFDGPAQDVAVYTTFVQLR
jgi:hypothetical protein